MRQRLLKYGTLLPAGGLATLLGTASTAPARLLGKTAESVAQVTAAGGILTGVVPASVATLSLEATSMALFKLKIATAMAVTLATLTLGLVAADGPKVPADKPAAAVPKAAIAIEKPAVLEGDLATLQGLWEAVRPGANDPAVAGMALVRGEVLWIVMSDSGHVSRHELRLKPGRNPKWVDLVGDGCSSYVSEQVTGLATPGVYRVTADGWELAIGKLRPAEFVNEDGVKALRFQRPKIPVAPDAKLADARKGFVGRWTVTRQAYPHDDRSAMVDRPVGEVEITPEFLFIQRPADDKKFVWEAAEYTLDPTKDPKWVDLKFTGKSGGDANGYGVYELAGDTLRISYRQAVPRVFRTLEFKAGLEDAIAGPDGKPAVPKPACGLLELKRAKSP